MEDKKVQVLAEVLAENCNNQRCIARVCPWPYLDNDYCVDITAKRWIDYAESISKSKDTTHARP